MTEPRHAADHPIALLVNPNSTAATPGLTEYAITQLAPFGVRAVLTTQERGHAAELATLAMQEHDALTVVTLGGDGTAAEAAGALVGTGAALAPMPTGSTNVFARSIGWPMDPRTAINHLVAALRGGQHAEEVTIGHLRCDDGEERFFIVNAGVGIDAEAADIVEREWRSLGDVINLQGAGHDLDLPRGQILVLRAGGAAHHVHAGRGRDGWVKA